MKQIFTSFLVLFFMNMANAATIDISVTNSQFSPANVNVNVGDIVRFNFTQGFHNATTNNVPDGLPSGATALFSGNPGSVATYSYPVTAAGTYKYICEVHGTASTFSGMKGQFIASLTLPVILNKFLVNITSQKKPLLAWSTETEINSDHFSVRRSTDGVNFTEIKKIAAAGNSSSKLQYAYTDEDINNKDKFIYYELAIVDKDGKQKLSSIQVFRNALATPKLIAEIGPNPISKHEQLMVYFNSEKKGAMKVRMFDGTGKQVFSDNMSAMPGLNSGHIHICGFSAGVYTLTFSLEGLKETKKIVIN